MSVEDPTRKLKQVEHRISILEWDAEMNQIHPFRLHQLKELKAEAAQLREQCEKTE
ncbi:hypothetical protein J4439_05580 [Candidatus Woesearchaeota archaeon]|nr:hypothetical protein [Candidatus Woesearchaeota archaeon]